MATGVPESEVFKAADAVLARGERPTVERVRVELGRGSPARVGQLLEQWWEQLAQRLKGQTLLPDLPGEVAQGFADLWRLAVARADTIARAALTEEQNALFAAQSDLTQERKLWELALAEAQATAAESTAKQAQAEAQLLERQTLVDQLTVQAADLRQQRDRLQAQLEQQRTEFTALRTEHAAAQEHIRLVEDRAHQQVDQARQELKALQQRLERDQREHGKTVAQLTAKRDELLASLRDTEQAAAHQAGRVAALEVAVAQWRGPSGRTPRKTTKAKPSIGRPRARRRKP